MGRMKVVFESGGRSREIVGWRRWAIAIPVLAIVAPLAAVAVLLAFGLAVTIGAVLVAAAPIALVLLFIALMFGRYEIRESASIAWVLGAEATRKRRSAFPWVDPRVPLYLIDLA